MRAPFPVLSHSVPCTVTYYRIRLKKLDLQRWVISGRAPRLRAQRPVHLAARLVGALSTLRGVAGATPSKNADVTPYATNVAECHRCDIILGGRD